MVNASAIYSKNGNRTLSAYLNLDTELPNKSKAYIPANKITGYLLSKTHAIGKSKAGYFRSLGFDETNFPELE